MMEPGPTNVQKSAQSLQTNLEGAQGQSARKTYKRWSRDEEATLSIEWLAGKPIEDITLKLNLLYRLNRTYGEVAVKASRLKLPMRKNRTAELQYTPIIDINTENIAADLPKIIKKVLPICRGPCAKPFKPAHNMQRICNKCREAIRMMCF